MRGDLGGRREVCVVRLSYADDVLLYGAPGEAVAIVASDGPDFPVPPERFSYIPGGPSHEELRQWTRCLGYAPDESGECACRACRGDHP